MGLRDVLGAYLLGTFLVPTLVFYPLKPVVNYLGSRSATLAIWWVPPVEETAILGAVSLIAWRLYRQRHRRPVMDLMLLGWCVGSGASIHEDALYGRLFSDLYGKTISGSFSTAYGWIFPTFSVGYFDDGTGLNTYHAGSGML